MNQNYKLSDVFNQLGANKVTVTYTSNNMNELDVFKYMGLQQDGKNPFDVFKDFDKIFGEAFPQTQQSGSTNKSTSTVSVPQIQKKDIHTTQEKRQDKFMMAIASHIDPTMSLLNTEDQVKKTRDFTTSLVDNLTNHNESYKKLNLKSFKISVADIKNALTSDRTSYIPALYYVSRLLNKNIIFKSELPKESINICINDEATDYLQIFQDETNSFTIEEKSESYKDAIISMYKNLLQDKEKLKKMTVANLRSLANELGVNTYKVDTESNKKTLLLKEGLVETLHQVITF